jgi:hypothetical protein
VVSRKDGGGGAGRWLRWGGGLALATKVPFSDAGAVVVWAADAAVTQIWPCVAFCHGVVVVVSAKSLVWQFVGLLAAMSVGVVIPLEGVAEVPTSIRRNSR